jgi:hypothetical protein
MGQAVHCTGLYTNLLRFLFTFFILHMVPDGALIHGDIHTNSSSLILLTARWRASPGCRAKIRTRSSCTASRRTISLSYAAPRSYNIIFSPTTCTVHTLLSHTNTPSDSSESMTNEKILLRSFLVLFKNLLLVNFSNWTGEVSLPLKDHFLNRNRPQTKNPAEKISVTWQERAPADSHRLK